MVAVSSANLHTSLGALVLGGLVSTALSGVVMMQTVLYYRLYETDHTVLKLVVALIAFLDAFHTCLVWAADYMYLVESFGNMNITDHVYWTAGLTIAVTAITTYSVHLFFSYRLFRLSKSNYFVTVPLVILSTGRTVSAIATSCELIRLGTYSEFYTHYRWLFTLGLVLSTAVDVMITSGLCLYLRKSRHGGTGRLDHVLNSVTLYTVENGLLTSITTALALVFWLVKPHTLIYLALHFAISKLYANSFLASMNARKLLRVQNASSSGSGHRLPVIFTHHLSNRDRRSSRIIQPDEVDFAGTKLQITVDKTVDYAADDPIPSPSMHRSDGTKVA